MSAFDTPQFEPYFVAAVAALNAHCGGGATVGSGYRTIDQQRALLYKRAQGISVADPGTSRHEGNHGGAFDLQFASDQVETCMHENANAFGLGFDVPGEGWHIQLSADGEAAIAAGTFAEQFGITADGEVEQPAEPEDSLAGIRSIIYGQGGPENPVDVPERVQQAFAPRPSRAAAQGAPEASEGFVPQASAGFSSDGSAMSAVDVAKVYAQAGFTGDALVTMVAIARGESGWNPGANGDTSIQTGTWGPSIGLSQIRSLNAQAGTGGWRDPTRLTDPVFNARAAFAISNGATNFSPWTVYSQGIYTQYMEEAKAAVLALGSGAVGAQGPPAASVSPEDDELGVDASQDLLDPVGISGEIAAQLLAARGSTRPQDRIHDLAAENELLAEEDEPERTGLFSSLRRG